MAGSYDPDAMKRLARLLAIRPGEGPLIALVATVVAPGLGAVLVTLVWTLGGSLLDARQAKRLFPLCTSAAILGGFAGTLAAGPLARLAGTENLLLADAALLAVAASITARVAPRIAARPA